MRELTEEIKANLRATHGEGALRFVSSTIETEDGEETLALVVRKPSLNDFDEVIDSAFDTKEQYELICNCVTKYAAWPTPSEVGLVIDGDPTIVDDAWREMKVLLGDDATDAMQQGGLASLTDDEKKSAGITDEQIATWRAADRRRPCMVFRTPLGLWICRRPGRSEYTTYRRGRDDMKLGAPLRGIVAECGVFPNADLLSKQIETIPAFAIAVGGCLVNASEKALNASGGI